MNDFTYTHWRIMIKGKLNTYIFATREAAIEWAKKTIEPGERGFILECHEYVDNIDGVFAEKKTEVWP